MRKSEKTTFQWPKVRSFTPLYVTPTALMVFFIFVQGCISRHASTCPWQEENCIFNLTFLSTQIALTVDTLHKKVEYAKAWTQSNLEIYFFLRLPQSPTRYTSLQGFIPGWLHPELFPLKFPQISPNFPKFPQIFQIDHFPPAWPAG